MRPLSSVKTCRFFSPQAALPALLAGLVLLAFSESAYSLPTPPTADWGPSTLSFGGAGAGLSVDHDAFLTNPANLAYFQNTNSVGGSWQNLPRDEQRWSVSLVDGKLPAVAGFHFTWNDYGPSQRHAYTLGGAYKTAYGAFGATAQALNFSSVARGNGWHFTGSIGVLIPAAYGISLAIYSRHLLDTESNTQLPPDVHMALLYIYPEMVRFSFESDRRFVLAGQDWNYSLGADLLFKKYFAVRGGYRFDRSGSDDFFSVGAAVLGPKMEITAAFTRTTERKAVNGLAFGASFKM